MISRIRGTIVSKHPNRCVVDVGGLAYDVLVPTAVEKLLLDRTPGDQVELHTMYYLQLEHTKATPVLIGFVNELQKEFFEQLLTVPKLGPKIAINAFSVPMSEVAQAIEQGSMTFLKGLPGVGNQKAKDIVATLQGKVAKYALMRDQPTVTAEPEQGAGEITEDALQMLLELGHSAAEAQRMVLDALSEGDAVETADQLVRVIYQRQSA